MRRAVSLLLIYFLALAAILAPANAQDAGQAPPAGQPAAPADYAPLTPDELDALVAPIALYPDALVAQVLGAATFPYEIPDAVVWLKDNSQLKGEALAKAVDQQSWDPSVKALTQFPTVLDTLAKNLAWTSSLGDASSTQQTDVMAAIQRMRVKAQNAGNLKSTSEITVVQQAPQTIVIQPANPQIVYVPVYNPTVIYGAPVVVPGYSSADVAAAAIISFGIGIAVGAAIYGGCCGWGWGYWGTNWHSSTIIFNRNIYVGNPYWRGGYYPGYRPGYPGYRPGYPGYHPGYPGYRPPPGGYPGYRPPVNGGYPGYGRPPGTYPPGNRPPATTLPAPGNPGNRPNPPNGNPGTRPGTGGPTTLPANRPTTRPTTQEARGYQPNGGGQPAARPNAFSGSAGGRAQSARGNQSLGSHGGGGGRGRR